ncbi:hypothetical protein SS50377_21310 [Spironucleus salmonicida]|uniref:Uncharacterized protein n=1 Tax=Spironucleus salmonicida TaxID=348837 RepID=A0A9P8LXK8_9EUKA|nr:hypothetical protein SS50377_21310 [Spironucleus salmonicida]
MLLNHQCTRDKYHKLTQSSKAEDYKRRRVAGSEAIKGRGKQVYVDLEKATVNVEKLKAQLLDVESKQNAKTETVAKVTAMVKQAEKKYAYAEQQIQKQDILLTKVGQIGGFSGSKEEYKSLTEKLSEIIKENEASQLALAKQSKNAKMQHNNRTGKSSKINLQKRTLIYVSRKKEHISLCKTMHTKNQKLS